VLIVSLVCVSSVRVLRAALYALRCACKDHLRAYPTTLEDDLALLRSPQLQRSGIRAVNMRNILTFRVGEKRIYRFFVDWATIAISLLCIPWDEARHRIRKILAPGAVSGFLTRWLVLACSRVSVLSDCACS
jgi:hypothetical protein